VPCVISAAAIGGKRWYHLSPRLHLAKKAATKQGEKVMAQPASVKKWPCHRPLSRPFAQEIQNSMLRGTASKKSIENIRIIGLFL
jgi:hypothetical protein